MSSIWVLEQSQVSLGCLGVARRALQSEGVTHWRGGKREGGSDGFRPLRWFDLWCRRGWGGDVLNTCAVCMYVLLAVKIWRGKDEPLEAMRGILLPSEVTSSIVIIEMFTRKKWGAR